MTGTDGAAAALEPLARMLDADGYELHIEEAQGVLRVSVLATPAGCADCLVSKETFVAIVEDKLSEHGLQYDLHVTYPEG